MKKEVKIGIFAVAMIGCLWAGIRFLSGIDIFSRNVDYYAAYEQVNGVQGASPVMMRGVKIGTVTEIILPSAQSEEVVLRLTLKKQYRLPKDSQAKIVGSLMGGSSIEILTGQSAEMLEKGDTIPSLVEPGMLDALTTELNPLMGKLNGLIEELTQTLEGVHGVVDNNAAGITGLVAHLNSISASLDEILTSEQAGLKQAVQGISEFSGALGENADRIDTLVGNLSKLSTSLSEASLVANLDKSLAELSGLLEEIRSGEGSIGKLVADPALYANLAAASENLSALLADLKEHPGRYVHISVFGANEEKQAAKQAKKEARQAEKAARQAEKAE